MTSGVEFLFFSAYGKKGFSLNTSEKLVSWQRRDLFRSIWLVLGITGFLLLSSYLASSYRKVDPLSVIPTFAAEKNSTDSRLAITHDDASLPNEFYAYPDGYQTRSVVAQVAIIRESFPELGSFDENLATKQVPAGAEANFAMPKWYKIHENYGKAVEMVLEAAHLTHRGKNLAHGGFSDFELGEWILLPNVRTEKLRMKLCTEQWRYDIVVVPAQFGARYAGKSAVEVREKLAENEFAFGAFELAVYLLTHPERLRSRRDAGLIAAGEDCGFAGESGFSLVPSLCQKGTMKLFLPHLKHNSFAAFGSPSCFLSE